MRTRVPHLRRLPRVRHAARSASAEPGSAGLALRDGPAPPAPRASWRRSRVRAAALVAALVPVVLVTRLVARLQTDWLWFHELGQDRVFWSLIDRRWLPGTLAGLGTAAFLLFTFWIAERTAPPPEPGPAGVRRLRLRRVLLPAYGAVAVVAGIAVASSVVEADWRHLILWAHRSDFGVTDPVFHRDVGFFVFSLPLYRRVAGWLLLTTGLALAGAVLAHTATGGIRGRDGPVSATRAARVHVLLLGALLLLLVAWEHRLGQYLLEVPRRGADLPGAGYTDVRVVLPWLRVRVIVAVGCAVMLLVATIRASWSLPAVAVVVLGLSELVNPSVLPAVVQRVVVDPQTLSRERPYLADSVRMTRRAYGLDGVVRRALPADGRITDGELQANRDVLANVQLWDTDVLRPEIDQQQAIGSYYSFPNITVDRYDRGGRPEGVIVAERELDLRRLEPSGRTWANDRFAYTHGYGLVAVPAGDRGVDQEGKPRFLTSGFDAGSPPALLRHPRLYFGVQPRRARPWVITDTHRAEVEQPLEDGAREAAYHYDGGRMGGAGIPLEGVLRRGLFALRFGEPNLLLSQTLGAHPRLLLHRDVMDRVRTLAPFLHWERHPQVAVVDGRVVFLAHGFTTSDTFPYGARTTMAGEEVNYLRGSVVATVDAFTGAVAMYVDDEGDPVVRAWREAFPSLLQPAERMPRGIREHLRYPKELFDVQSRMWAIYHSDDVDRFYTKADTWKRPADTSGPIQRVGDVRTLSGSEAPKLRPSYVLARLPGDPQQRFHLTTAFTPYSEENLSGYLAATMDPDGRPHLTELTVPRTPRVLGPAQVSRQILASPGVSATLRLLNQETTDLGERAVNAVEISDPQIIPIGGALLHVQAVYVTAQGTGVTRLRLVTVYLNGRIGYGPTLRAALRRAGASPP
jgi:uncharacterized membrane protein (UPF0182 family)